MDSFDLIQAFREVAAGGSFSGAAARLKMGKATVSKHVAELESRIGVRLLNRSTRAVNLTDAGALLLERLLPVIEVIQLTREELQELANRPMGRLHIAAAHGMSQGRMPKLLAKFLGHYPEGSISLQLSNRNFDLAEEAIDVAVNSRMHASEAGPLIEATIQGFGVLYLPALLVQSHIDHGELIQVLPTYEHSSRFVLATNWQLANKQKKAPNAFALSA